MRIFDKGLPSLPNDFWSNVQTIFEIKRSDFVRAITAATQTQQAEFPNDHRRFLSGEYSVGSQISVMQEWVKHGEKFVAVDESVLSDAENTDCLATLCGEDLKQTMKAFALWYPRRVRGTFSHIGMVRYYDEEELSITGGHQRLDYEIEGVKKSAHFQAGNHLPHGVKAIGLLSATLFHSYESTAGTHLLNIDGTQGIGIKGIDLRGTPTILLEEEIVRSDQGILETFVVPIYDRMTLLDSFCSTLHPDEAAPMREMYLSNSDPKNPMEQTRQGFLSALNVICSMMQVMSSYPEYLVPKQIQSRIPNLKNPKKKITRPFRIEELRAPVTESKGVADPKTAGITKRSHWRRGHWRRQIHAEPWRKENPGRAITHLPDGREAHLSWIKPIWIGR